MALDPAAKEETFSARELLERFASEDIEVSVNITIAMVHSNVDDEGHNKPMLKTSIRGSSMNGSGNNDKLLKLLARAVFSMKERKRSGHTRVCESKR